MKDQLRIQGFKPVTNKELEEVNGGWLWEVIGAFAIICLSIYHIITTLNNN